MNLRGLFPGSIVFDSCPACPTSTGHVHSFHACLLRCLSGFVREACACLFEHDWDPQLFCALPNLVQCASKHRFTFYLDALLDTVEVDVQCIGVDHLDSISHLLQSISFHKLRRAKVSEDQGVGGSVADHFVGVGQLRLLDSCSLAAHSYGDSQLLSCLAQYFVQLHSCSRAACHRFNN